MDIHPAVGELDHTQFHFQSLKNLYIILHGGCTCSHSSQQCACLPCRLLSFASVVAAICQGVVASHYGGTHLLKKLISSLTSPACTTNSKPHRDLHGKTIPSFSLLEIPQQQNTIIRAIIRIKSREKATASRTMAQVGSDVPSSPILSTMEETKGVQ